MQPYCRTPTSPRSTGSAIARSFRQRCVPLVARWCGILSLLLLPFSIRATDFYWSGGSGSSDNIDQGDNWWTSGNPSSGDNLYFDNTPSGNRLTPFSNYGSGSWFGNMISYSGAGAIRWRGDTTEALKIENFNNPSVFEFEANVRNRLNEDIEVNPVGSGGIRIMNGLHVQNNDKWIHVYGNNTLTVDGVISGNSGVTMTIHDLATVILHGENTFPGDLNIRGGAVDLRNTTDPLDVARIYLGHTSGSQDATLRIGASGVTVDNPVTVQSGNSGIMRIDYNVTSGSGTLNQTITLDKTVSQPTCGRVRVKENMATIRMTMAAVINSVRFCRIKMAWAQARARWVNGKAKQTRMTPTISGNKASGAPKTPTKMVKPKGVKAISASQANTKSANPQATRTAERILPR